METKYTIGIYLDMQLGRVALILKNRPDWQKGLFNFPGGHLEEGETPEEGISREFKEECLVETTPEEWSKIGLIKGADYSVNILLCIYQPTHLPLETGEEDQPVSWHWLEGLPDNCIQNIYWLTYYALEIQSQRMSNSQYDKLTLNNVFNYNY